MESAPINDPGLSARPLVVRDLLGVTYQVERQMRAVVRGLYDEKMRGAEYDQPLRDLLKKDGLITGIAKEASSRLNDSGFGIISRASWYPNWVFAQIHVRRLTRKPRAQTSKSSMESAPEHEAATSSDAGEAGPEVGAEVGAGVGTEIEAGVGAGANVVRWRPW